MQDKPAKLTKAQRRDLERLFVAARGGRTALLTHVTTISLVTNLDRLHSLQQMGLLTYSDIANFHSQFGVHGWHCRLTASARAALERELAMSAS
jgi:hypothetical protein